MVHGDAYITHLIWNVDVQEEEAQRVLRFRQPKVTA